MGRAGLEHPIIVFDAECVLCCANAQMVLRNDRKQIFRLASMQGQFGARLLRANGIDPADPDTIIVVTDEGVLRNSDAVLFVYRGLGFPWSAFALLQIIPRRLRDPVYRWIARHRYRWFGKLEECWVPQASDRDRLL